MAKIRTDIMAWRKIRPLKCKLQKYNFDLKSLHRGCDADLMNRFCGFVKCICEVGSVSFTELVQTGIHRDDVVHMQDICYNCEHGSAWKRYALDLK